VADCAAGGVLSDALLAAETALLRAKAAGRNRTVCAEPDVSSS
jgi:PleD family two-component response regulator